MNIIGIVNISSNKHEVQGLDVYRSISSLSFLGRYRLIDFQLSNFTNSDIDNIMIHVKNHPKSLTDHVGTGSSYNVNAKKSHVSIFYPGDSTNSLIYNHDLNALKKSLRALRFSKEDYVVIAPGHTVVSIDYREYLDQFIKSGCDVACLYKHINDAEKEFIGIGRLEINPQGGVIKIRSNRGDKKSANISLETYIMKKETLIDILETKEIESTLYWLKDVINQMAESQQFDIRGFEYDGYYRNINSAKAYYEANKSLLDTDERARIFKRNWPIYTKTHDSQPTLYYKDADVKESIVANGCKIHGKIRESIIGRNVVIEEGASIERCIVLSDSFISKDTVMKNVILDRYVKVIHTKKIVTDNLTYIKRDDII